jgi:hypothetical protein
LPQRPTRFDFISTAGLLRSDLQFVRAFAYDAALGINRVAGRDSDRTSKRPISGAQIRAARALLKWSVRELSAQSRVSRSAIARGEKFDSAFPMQVRNLEAIWRTFEEHGIEFLGLDGVRLLSGHRRIERRINE